MQISWDALFTVCPAAALALFQWHAAKTGGETAGVWAAISAASIVMLIAKGLYWSPFPRGHGFWTANRVSAIAVLVAACIGPWLLRQAYDRVRAMRAEAQSEQAD